MNNITYGTSDLALAAYLKVRGYSILNINHNGGNKATFHFEDAPGREKEVLKFFNRQVKVEPIGFLDHVKSLKAMITQR